MTQFLPANLLALFSARPPIPFKPPPERLKKRKNPKPIIGISDFIGDFEVTLPPPATRGETREEREDRKQREKKEAAQSKLEEKILTWDPHSDENATGDPFKTLFVARINYDTTENKLRRELETYGPIKRIQIVCNREKRKPRGYAFVEYEHEKDMHSAYKHADGKKIEGKRIVVDVERGRTVKSWRPRRLGGGLGGTRRGAPDDCVRHSGRVEQWENNRERGGDHGGEKERPEREERKERKRSRSPRDKERRDRERGDRERGDRERGDRDKGDRERGDKDRDRERKRDRGDREERGDGESRSRRDRDRRERDRGGRDRDVDRGDRDRDADRGDRDADRGDRDRDADRSDRDRDGDRGDRERDGDRGDQERDGDRGDRDRDGDRGDQDRDGDRSDKGDRSLDRDRNDRDRYGDRNEREGGEREPYRDEARVTVKEEEGEIRTEDERVDSQDESRDKTRYDREKLREYEIKDERFDDKEMGSNGYE